MRSPLLLLTALFAAACTERLTAPEAVRVIEELDASQRAADARRFHKLLVRLDWLAPARDVRAIPADTVQLRHEGTPRTYHVTVFERLMPDRELDQRDRCARAPLARRSALLWREHDPQGGLILRGGDFTRPLGAGEGNCNTIRLVGPSPILVFMPDPDDPNQEGWVSESGQADIGPGVVTGPCDFLDSATVRMLRLEVGVTCQTTRHSLRFQAVVRRDQRTMNVDLESVEVPGVRYTLHCDGTAASARELCEVRQPYATP